MNEFAKVLVGVLPEISGFVGDLLDGGESLEETINIINETVSGERAKIKRYRARIEAAHKQKHKKK